MKSSASFKDKSYSRHSEHFKEYIKNGPKASHAKTWFQKDTVNAWRHERMYQSLDPVIESDPHAKWLTVGDGRYGNDAKYILEKGCDVLATDISKYLLEEAKEMGHIEKYKTENAEALSFKKSEFDYVFCKESYHHFPRPMIALHEMLRVAKKGVLLIEPNDNYIDENFLSILFRNIKFLIKILLRKKIMRHFHEESGNYMYSISKRELEKVALGLNYEVVAFKGLNDAYITGVEYEKLSDNGPVQKKVRRLIFITNILAKIGLTNYGILASIIFKEKPSNELLQNLIDHGYDIIHLPKNPYITP